MKTVLLDGAKITCPEDVHDAFAAVLRFPDWYGRNLDALFDLLTQPAVAVTVILRRTELLEAVLGRRWRSLRRCLRDAAAQNPRITILEEN